MGFLKKFDEYFINLGKKKYYRDTHKFSYAVEYFFAFSEHLLIKINSRPDWTKGAVFLSDEETYNFRNFWESSKGMPKGTFGVFFYSKIELNASNFTNLHIENGTTHLIDEALKNVHVNSTNPEVVEVSNYLKTIF